MVPEVVFMMLIDGVGGVIIVPEKCGGKGPCKVEQGVFDCSKAAGLVCGGIGWHRSTEGTPLYEMHDFSFLSGFIYES